METSMECVATCRPGLETVLRDEIDELGGLNIRNSKRAVHFVTDRAGLYRMNMALRAAIQVLVPLRTFNARDYQILYYQARRTNWHQYFGPEKTLRIDVNGRSPNLRNTQYVVHRVKDGIVDTFRKLADGVRPSIDKEEPQIHVVAHLEGNRVTLCLDSSGIPLFKRGYRLVHGGAPLKEDLAAGMLLLAGLRPGMGLVDPMCGSGTLLFEGWMIQNCVAPNKEREFAFQHWLDYDAGLHHAEQAKLEEAAAGAERVVCEGCEVDEKTAELAGSIREAHFPDSGIEIHQVPFQEFNESFPGALLATNPPYGERMGKDEDLGQLYRDLGEAAKRLVPDGNLAFFTANRKAARQVRLKPDRSLTLFNGALEGVFYQYGIRGSD